MNNSIMQQGDDRLDIPQIRYADIQPYIHNLAKDKRLSIEEIGRSHQDRPINSITLGQGEIKIMAWTQMHGDEPTATASIFDLIELLLADAGPFDFKTFEQSFTLKIIPMLNPDGAEQETRINAQGLDINRDALDLQTPEGRVLMEAAKQFKPDVGFNLHDQCPFYSAGDTANHATIAYLAPAFDEEKTVDPARHRAMQLIALMSDAISQHIPNRIARYNDAFGPRCFGDNLAGLGISTILIESGEHPADPNRQIARKLNVNSILTTMQAMLDSSYKEISIDDYFALPENRKDGLLPQRLKKPSRALVPTANAEKPGWLDRHNQKMMEAAESGRDVQWVFLGDSITQAWEDLGREQWDKHFAPLGALNIGFGGDRTEHLLWRVENGALDNLSPKGVMLLVGTNNTGHHFDDPEDTATAIAEIVSAIHQRLPSAKIVVHAILPSGRHANDKKRLCNEQINRMIRWLRQRPYVQWLNLGHLFTDENGVIPESVMSDALHPNASQYKIWAEALLPELKQFET